MLETIKIETLRKDAERKIRLYEEQKVVFEVIKDTFKKFDGKQVNKRLATALEKELANTGERYVVSYQKNTWYEFYIWNNDDTKSLCYRNKLLVMFGEDQLNEGKLDSGKVIKKLTWLDSPDSSLEEVKRDLDLINNTNIVEEYNIAVETIRDIENTLTALRTSLSR